MPSEPRVASVSRSNRLHAIAPKTLDIQADFVGTFVSGSIYAKNCGSKPSSANAFNILAYPIIEEMQTGVSPTNAAKHINTDIQCIPLSENVSANASVASPLCFVMASDKLPTPLTENDVKQYNSKATSTVPVIPLGTLSTGSTASSLSTLSKSNPT